MTQTDQVLLDLALGGDADSFGRLVERWQGRVFGFIVRYTGDREDARDLTQDTFAKAYQNLARLSDPTSFPAWVYKIALNECRMRFRRSKRSKQVDLDEDVLEILHGHRRWCVLVHRCSIMGAAGPAAESARMCTRPIPVLAVRDRARRTTSTSGNAASLLPPRVRAPEPAAGRSMCTAT